jgi:hypothetical protein
MEGGGEEKGLEEKGGSRRQREVKGEKREEE